MESAPVKDVKDAITAHTLAGHVEEALSAFMVLLSRHKGAVEAKDMYQGRFRMLAISFEREGGGVWGRRLKVAQARSRCRVAGLLPCGVRDSESRTGNFFRCGYRVVWGWGLRSGDEGRGIRSEGQGWLTRVPTGALLAKSAGEGGLAIQLLHMYLGGIGWPEWGATDKAAITALSFLSTLQFESGQVRP